MSIMPEQITKLVGETLSFIGQSGDKLNPVYKVDSQPTENKIEVAIGGQRFRLTISDITGEEPR